MLLKSLRSQCDEQLSAVIALALGNPPASGVRDWQRLLDMAIIERCAVLAWLRSGDRIRAEAPGAVVSAWRRLALQIAVNAESQLTSVARCVAVLEAAGVQPVVFKGLPLAARLYGDFRVRASTDIDLFVRHDERAEAAQVLAAYGWQLKDGHAPFEELWTADGEPLLEVQSSILSDRLSHLAPPTADYTRYQVGAEGLPSHSGPLQPVHLAVHLAKHQLAPLLWWIDLATLWQTLPSSVQETVHAESRRLRLHRYLQWALGRCALLPDIGQGQPVAMRAFGFAEDGRRDAHSVWRDVTLAPSPFDATRVIGDWIWPRRERANNSGFARQAARRLRLRWRQAVVARETYAR